MDVDRVKTFKIFVGNIPPDATADDVRQIFEEFGTVVECHEVGGKAVFVHMEDDIEGKHAVGELQGRELNGHKLVIEQSRKDGMPGIPTVKLLVKNISSSVDARGLRNMFKRFGCVIEVQIENGEGHVCLEAIGDIRSAIKDMNGYKIDDMELSVEPAPTPAPSAEPSTSTYSNSPKKDRNTSFKNKGYDKYGSSWTPVEQGNADYYECGSYGNGYESYGNDYESHGNDYESYGNDYESHGNDYESYDYNPWSYPSSRSFMQSEPEKILRDPRRGFGGPMGQRKPPSRNLPPPPSNFQDSSMGGGTRIMRSGMPMLGQPNPFANRGPPQQHHNPWQVDYGESAFYDDEPAYPRGGNMPQGRRNVTGANSMPLGSGDGPVSRNPGGPPSFRRGNNGNANRRGGGGRGRGRGTGKPNKFTALTEDVVPGEKYPVPPAYNPGFRAPNKRPKEEIVKRKNKKKKKPLVAAELPDYSVPVPELPKPTLPKGTIFTPFPPPQGQSVIDSDTFGGGGSANFFEHQEEQNQNDNDQTCSSHMDFTADELV